ncbi:MAG TPA: nucleotidyltransferase [Cyclobacteriaceae bacterium]|nr:nucleotidyltransferase [Cyclobacteriaceae bacterium]
MNILTEAHKKLLIELLESGIEFLVIGGYAVNYHGYPRFTVDLDIWLKPDNMNKQRFIDFIRDQGISNESIENLEKLDFSETQAFHFGEQGARIDFLTKISGVEFNEAYARHAKLPLADKIVPVIRYEDLIINKMISGRPRDKADIDELQKIRRFKGIE